VHRAQGAGRSCRAGSKAARRSRELDLSFPPFLPSNLSLSVFYELVVADSTSLPCTLLCIVGSRLGRSRLHPDLDCSARDASRQALDSWVRRTFLPRPHLPPHRLANLSLFLYSCSLSPEYFEDQMSAGPSLNPTSAAIPPPSPSNSLARHFEHPSSFPAPPTSTVGSQGLNHSEALIRNSAHLGAIQALATQFGGKTVDISSGSVIVEMTGKTERVDAFLGLVRPYGILEAVRSGEFLSSFSSLELSKRGWRVKGRRKLVRGEKTRR